MANDRLYLACRVCGDTCGMFKYYPSGGYIARELTDGPDGGYLGHWIDEHIHTFDADVPPAQIPELVNETQVGEMQDELRERRQRWEDGDYDQMSIADRSSQGPQWLRDHPSTELLPTNSMPALAFDAAVRETHAFPLLVRAPGPAVVTIQWYLDQTWHGKGTALWTAQHVRLWTGDHRERASQFSSGWFPQVVIPTMIPNHSVDLPVTFLTANDNAADLLVVGRDPTNAGDTAAGDAVVTNIQIWWSDSR